MAGKQAAARLSPPPSPPTHHAQLAVRMEDLRRWRSPCGEASEWKSRVALGSQHAQQQAQGVPPPPPPPPPQLFTHKGEELDWHALAVAQALRGVGARREDGRAFRGSCDHRPASMRAPWQRGQRPAPPCPLPRPHAPAARPRTRPGWRWAAPPARSQWRAWAPPPCPAGSLQEVGRWGRGQGAAAGVTREWQA